MADMSFLSTTMDNFIVALKGMPAIIKPISIGLLGALVIIDLLWTYHKEILEIDWIKYLVRKALSVGLIMYIINDYENIVESVLNGFIRLGSIVIPGSGASQYVDNPSLLMSKITNMSLKIWDSSSGFKEGLLAIALIVPLLIVGAVLSFQIILSFIEFYFMTGLSLIFVPLGTIQVGQQYFSSVFKSLIGCSLKITTIQIVLSLSESTLSKATATNKFDFQSSIVLILTYAIVAYVALKIPSMAASLLTGSPTMNGNDVAKMIGNTAKAATMVGVAAAAGAIAGGLEGAGNGESKAGKAGKALLGGVSGAVAGATNEMKHNIFGGGSQGIMERGSKGKEELKSLFSQAGKSEKTSNSNNSSATGSTQSASSNTKNNSTSKENMSTNDDSKSKNNTGNNNISQLDTKNDSMQTNVSSSPATENDKPNIFSSNYDVGGKDGIRGERGDSGKDGIKGDEGKSGDTGEAGEVGEKGTNDEKKIYNSDISSANSANINNSSDDNRTSLKEKKEEDEDK